MKIKYQILFFCMATLFSSCEDVVQIKLDEGSKLYVIDAFVNNLKGIQTIRVTTNDSYFSNREAPPVSNAQVILKDLTADKEFLFSYSGNGNYIYNVGDSNMVANVNHQYELNVNIEGFSYRSLSVQKRTAAIDSIVPNYSDGGGFGGPSNPFYYCMLYAKDKVDNDPDYYWVKTFRNDTLLFGPSDINISIDGTNGPVSGVAVDSIEFTPPVTFIGFNRYWPGNSCRVEIHSLSRDAYYFFVQASAQISNGGLFATTPENVKTNIITPPDAKTKAIGWFNMATVASKQVVIP
jgi:hypothetical protein